MVAVGVQGVGFQRQFAGVVQPVAIGVAVATVVAACIAVAKAKMRLPIGRQAIPVIVAAQTMNFRAWGPFDCAQGRLLTGGSKRQNARSTRCLETPEIENLS